MNMFSSQFVSTVSQSAAIPLARFSLFVVYVWFGALKVFGVSPASPLVQQLFDATIPLISFESFIIWFGLFEVLIGVLFILRGAERAAIALFLLHMVTTFMPLIVIPSAMWTSFFVPTIEGQYVIKNLALLAAAATIGAGSGVYRRTTR